MIGSLSLLAASSPESLWKGWRYGECTKWKRLESQMGSQSSDGNGDQGSEALILCIAEGKHCDAEMVRQPALARAIKTEMASQEFRVRGEFIEISGFLERYQDTKSKTSKSTEENRKPKDGKGGKDTQDGKGGKDHHSSLPSRSRPQQAEFITPAHHQRSVPAPLPRAMFRGEASNRVGRNDRLGGGCDNMESRES